METYHDKINSGFSVVLGCGACPEAYDVYIDKIWIGYLRLRHGYFVARLKFLSVDKIIYETSDVKGDGIFYDDAERTSEIVKAMEAFERELKELDLVDICGCHECKTLRIALKGESFVNCVACNALKFHFLVN